MDELWKMAAAKGFVKRGRVVGMHADMLKWLKTEVGLGHVHASFMIMYIRLRTDDPGVTPRMKAWANRTGYRK